MLILALTTDRAIGACIVIRSSRTCLAKLSFFTRDARCFRGLLSLVLIFSRWTDNAVVRVVVVSCIGVVMDIIRTSDTIHTRRLRGCVLVLAFVTDRAIRFGVVIGSRYASFAEFSDRARYARITFLLGLTLIFSCSADSTVVDMIVCGGIGIVVGVVRAGLTF